MKLGISKRYALWFSMASLVILVVVLITTIAVITRGSTFLQERLREGTIQNFEALQLTTMVNLGRYLKEELFRPLYELDIEEIDHSINDLRQGMPIESVRIADASGKVLTDGTGDNRSFGMKLQLDRAALNRNPVLTERTAGGHRVTFLIGFKGTIAGFGELVFSDTPLKEAIERQDEAFGESLENFKKSFVNITVTGALFIGLLTVLIGILFSRTLTSPLIALRNAAGRIARGDLDYRVKIRSHDEIGDLAASFNTMVKNLRERSTELARTNQVLQTEIAERKKTQETATYRASHDLLTDLPNRTLFAELLTLELAQARRRQSKVAVMFLDLDRFKSINDTLGHDIGDKLLKEVAARIKKSIRTSDTAARIGGDEFNIMASDIMRSHDTADVARKILKPFGVIFDIAGHKLHITTSIGISMYPDDGDSADTLIKNADIALYHVKKEGGNDFHFYDHSMNTLTIERMILDNHLRNSLERGELLLYYQPQIEIQSGKMVCAEALIRWQHPNMGLLDPKRFIPLAEETGFITFIDEWVLRAVCRQLRSWRDAGRDPVCITVNLSTRQFQNPKLVEKVANILTEYGVSPSCLDLEVTESTAMRNIQRTAATLMELSGMGVHISIDDFGTGYSSLNYLKRLPIERLKIDKSFIEDIATDPDDRAIISAVTAMAHNMKMKVIAEGVETEEQLSFLRSSGCDQMQGYLFSLPLPAGKFADLITAGS